MNLKRILSSNVTLLASLGVLVLTIGYYKLKTDPPKIANLFSPVKPGALIFESDEFITVNKPV